MRPNADRQLPRAPTGTRGLHSAGNIPDCNRKPRELMRQPLSRKPLTNAQEACAKLAAYSLHSNVYQRALNCLQFRLAFQCRRGTQSVRCWHACVRNPLWLHGFRCSWDCCTCMASCVLLALCHLPIQACCRPTSPLLLSYTPAPTATTRLAALQFDSAAVSGACGGGWQQA
jgi:hypothetical protein